MANEVLGPKSYLYLMSESTWGTKPGSPQRVIVPVESYDVQFQANVRQATPFLGLFQRKHSRRRQGMPQGNLNSFLFAYQFGVDEDVGGTTVPPGSSISLAEYLLDWAMVDEAATLHEATDLPSKTAEWAEGPDVSNAEHNGLRVNQATLAGDESSGVVSLNCALMGKTESSLGSAQGLPDDFESLAEMEFEDCVFKIDDGAGGALAAVDIASFQLQVQHNLITRYNNSSNPTLLIKTDRLTTLNVTLDKNSSTYDDVRRVLASEKDYVAQIIVQGLNNGTGSQDWTIGTIDINQARYVTHQDQRPRDNIFQQPLQFICLKPDTTSPDIEIAWTEAASKAS